MDSNLTCCGTEVEGSCQRVDGDPIHNTGLLGYLLDGKHRLISIKEKNGKILARRIVRMLWDADAKKPVLLMERLYPTVISEEIENRLDGFTKQRANDLGLDLYKAGAGTANLESMGCKVPWEYVDSVGGIQHGGIYKVAKADRV